MTTTWATPFTVLTLGLWVWAFVYVLRRHRPFYAMVLVLASVFAFMSEYSAIRLGKYYYGDFPLAICFGTPAPLPPWLLGWLHQPRIEGCLAPNWCIPLGVLALEGLVLFSILRTTDVLGVNRWSKPFVDGLLAINLDAIFDPVASSTRWCSAGDVGDLGGLGLWTWYTGPEDAGYWFGIPLANYTAWFGSVLAFTISVRTVAHFLARERHNLFKELLAALASLVGLFVLSAVIVLIFDRLLNVRFDAAWQFGVSGGVVLLSVLVILPTMRSWQRNQPIDWLPVIVQGSLYAFCLAAILFTGKFDSKPGLIWVWLLTTLIGMGLVLLPYRKARTPTAQPAASAA